MLPSPAAQAQERDEWLAFLNLVLNPQVAAVLSQSPYLMRKTAGYFNIHNERDLAEISQAMMQAEQQVAHGATHDEGLVAGLLQGGGHLDRVARDQRRVDSVFVNADDARRMGASGAALLGPRLAKQPVDELFDHFRTDP